jgi:hypothetical protein
MSWLLSSAIQQLSENLAKMVAQLAMQKYRPERKKCRF